MKPSLGALTLSLFLGLLSCTPPPPPQAALPDPPVPSPPVAETPPATVAPAPARVTPRPTPARPFDESLLRGREFLLEAQSSPRPLLRDFDLGELNLDVVQVRVIEGFFRDAADGKLEPASVDERWSIYLNQWARAFQAQGGESPRVRVGIALVSEEGVVMVPVRLSTRERAQAGWVALLAEGKDYRVSDVQLVEVPLRNTPYDPESP